MHWNSVISMPHVLQGAEEAAHPLEDRLTITTSTAAASHVVYPLTGYVPRTQFSRFKWMQAVMHRSVVTMACCGGHLRSVSANLCKVVKWPGMLRVRHQICFQHNLYHVQPKKITFWHRIPGQGSSFLCETASKPSKLSTRSVAQDGAANKEVCSSI